MTGRWRIAAGRDDGQVTVLVIGFVVLALAVVAVVTSAAQVHLERTRLAALADLAALAAAERVSDEAYFAPSGGGPGTVGGSAAADGGPAVTEGGPVATEGGPAATDGVPAASGAERPGPGGTGRARLGPSDDEVVAVVDAYLHEHPDPSARWTGLRVVTASCPDGRTVRVTLAAVVRPAWTAWVLEPFTDGIAIGASSAARAW